MKNINFWLRDARRDRKRNPYSIETWHYAGSAGLNACLQPFVGVEFAYEAGIAVLPAVML